MSITIDKKPNQSALNSSVGDFREIYKPIKVDLNCFETELYGLLKSATSKNKIESDIINYYFKESGKYLRPLLVLHSVKAAAPKTLDDDCYRKSIKLAVVVELIHNASLVHDDILDDSMTRRERESLNKKFGNHVAVLSGDILYALAFSTLIDLKHYEIMKKLCHVTEQMCVGEIYNLDSFLKKNSLKNAGSLRELKDTYLQIIEKKTALFMSACCECGALVSGADQKTVKALSAYGYNLGMIYQFVDDYIDNDFVWKKHENEFFPMLNKYSTALENSLKVLTDTEYRQKLSDLHNHILSRVKKN